MGIAAYVKNKQPFVYQTFCHALKEGRVAHAYFLSGEAGTPLKEVAIYLAKSLLCDKPDPMACEVCTTCARIDKGDYPDFVFYDGEEETVKKEAITTLISSLARTSLEAKGTMVYVINHVENMKAEAANSLLKFLEEPPANTYAILTSQNEERVLPTILSRCEKLRLLLAPRSEVIKEAVGLGVEQEDAELLSHFINDADLLKAETSKEDYALLKENLLNFLDALSQTKAFARYTMEKDVIPNIKGKPALRLFFDMLSLFLKDALALKRGDSIYLSAYATILSALSQKLPNLEENIVDVMTMRAEIESNINPGLLLTHLVYVLSKE